MPVILAPMRLIILQSCCKVWFTGGIVNGGGAFCQGSCHYNIGRTGYRWFIQQQVGAMQISAIEVIKTIIVVSKGRSLFFKADDMGIQTPPANFIATGFWDKGFFKAPQHRTGQHDRATQLAAFL